jgi:hypothetical protein
MYILTLVHDKTNNNGTIATRSPILDAGALCSSEMPVDGRE